MTCNLTNLMLHNVQSVQTTIGGKPMKPLSINYAPALPILMLTLPSRRVANAPCHRNLNGQRGERERGRERARSKEID